MNHDNDALIRIAGYGACMINGYPHHAENSFFARFLRRLDQFAHIPNESEVFSLGGFPVERASRFVSRVVKYEPHLVVLQFGSTDLTISLKNHLFPKWLRSNPLGRHGSEANKPQPLGPFRSNLARRFLESIKFQMCRTMHVHPNFGDTQAYMNSMDKICSSLREASIEPVILAPFPHGDRVSNLWARRFSDALDEYSKSRQILFVDAHAELDKVPKEALLLADKLHLSELGHQLLGEVLFEKAVPLVVAIHQALSSPGMRE